MRVLLFGSLLVLAASVSLTRELRADILVNFDGGNSGGVVDAYLGTAGDGWLGAWRTEATRSNMTSTQILGSNPLVSGGGNYLDVAIDMDSTVTDLNYGQGCVARTYDDYYGEFGATSPHTIEFQVRTDEDLGAGGTFSSSNDHFYFFDNPTVRNGTAAENSWGVFAFGANYETAVGNEWAFYNGHQDGWAFDEYRLINTGLTLAAGTTYDFTITVDPANRRYDASVTNGSVTSTITGLGFRTAVAEAGRILHFGGKGNQPADVRAFSLDSIRLADNGGGDPPDPSELPTADGFRGIWYYNQHVGPPTTTSTPADSARIPSRSRRTPTTRKRRTKRSSSTAEPTRRTARFTT
ncbi:MAG TPA: hypothetical protein VJL29_10750 [Thermoguttaceae bacterium]|nr:hypothetical protein [Thermoguttaceae bacterium]